MSLLLNITVVKPSDILLFYNYTCLHATFKRFLPFAWSEYEIWVNGLCWHKEQIINQINIEIFLRLGDVQVAKPILI